MYGLISRSFLAFCLFSCLLTAKTANAQIQGDFPLDFPMPSFDHFFKRIEEMEKRFFGDKSDFFKDFEHHFGMGGNAFSQGEWREDKEHKIYVIRGVPLKESPLKISVKGGQVTVEGTLEKRQKKHQGSKRQKGLFQQRGIYRFSQQFPAPAGTDPTRIKVENKKDEVHLLFPKVAPKTVIPPSPPAQKMPEKRHTPPGTRPLEQREGETII